MRGRAAWRPRRAVAGVALVVAVGLVHWLAAKSLVDALAGWGPANNGPKRLQAAFVRELLPSAPPPAPPAAAVPAAKPAKRPRAAAQPMHRASVPVDDTPVAAEAARPPPSDSAASEPLAAAEPAASDASPDEPVTKAVAASAPASEAAAATAGLAASSPQAAASGISTAAAGAASAPAFDWPASTRLSYDFVGNYRGEVRGSAQVEWVRVGERYQVHLDVIGGLSFAPLFTRRMTSDGLITPAGLAPLRYDEDSKRAFAAPRHLSLLFDGREILLANGQRRPRPPGVQDSASQFVQLVWMFTLQPGLLQAGQTIEMPLALARSVDTWVYDVIGAETIYTPFGALDSVHVKPRREARANGDMTVEIWFVPSLQYLPARIRIHQDAATFIDLMLARPPLQAEPAASAASR